MKVGGGILYALIIMGVVFSAGVGESGEIYCYIDENGKAHFSNFRLDHRYLPWGDAGWDDPENNYRRLEGLIERLSRKHRVSPELVKAIIKVESNFNPRAVSPKGAMGLMQLMPETASRWGVTRPFDPVDNIEGGVRHLKFLFTKFSGDVRKILAAYNAGENIVEELGGIPPYRETINYVKLVLNEFRKFQRMKAID